MTVTNKGGRNSMSGKGGIKCPKCGSTNIEIVSRNVKEKKKSFMAKCGYAIFCVCLAFIPLIISLIKKAIFKKKYGRAICKDCGHQWNV